MKNWMKVFASTAFVAIGSIALAASAYGQGFPRIPTNCIIIADQVFVNNQPFTSAGTMDLDPGLSSPPDEPVQWMQLINKRFNAKSEDPVLGTITWELDDSRPVFTSMLRSNQAGQLFPATVQLDFNVRATISSQPGRVFLSKTPISITNNTVTSWPPGIIDQLNTVQGVEVTFIDKATGQPAFIVNRVRSRVRD